MGHKMTKSTNTHYLIHCLSLVHFFSKGLVLLKAAPRIDINKFVKDIKGVLLNQNANNYVISHVIRTLLTNNVKSFNSWTIAYNDQVCMVHINITSVWLQMYENHIESSFDIFFFLHAGYGGCLRLAILICMQRNVGRFRSEFYRPTQSAALIRTCF